MQTKKGKLLCMVMAVLLICLSACSNGTGTESETKGKEEENKQTAKQTSTESEPNKMGRYMESEIELPELGEDEYVVNIIQDEKERLHLFKGTKEKTIEQYQLTDHNTWEPERCDWIKEALDYTGETGYIKAIILGEDGNYYVSAERYEDGKGVPAIFRQVDETHIEKLPISYLEKKIERNGAEFYPNIQKLEVLQDGTICINDYWVEDMIYLFSGDTLKKIDEVEIGRPEVGFISFTIKGNQIIGADKKYTGFSSYHAKTKETKLLAEFEFKEGINLCKLQEDNSLLVLNGAGVHYIAENGTLWETFIDGELNSIGTPSVTPNNFFKKTGVNEGKDEYYIYVYDDGNKLLHFTFDETVSAVPENELTVYSLKENQTIRQAISNFQKEHADIRVRYSVAMGEEGGETSDYIRALNTELLNGTGADILVLDGLPVESYIEKGVLEDFSDCITPLVSEEKILPTIADDYTQSDGAVYQMPFRYQTPYIIGEKDAVEAIDSIEKIVQFCEANKQKGYFHSMSYNQLMNNLLVLNYNTLLEEDGKTISKEALLTFLENSKIIADQTGAKEHAEEWEEDLLRTYATQGAIIDSNYFPMVKENSYVTLDQFLYAVDFFIPATLIEDKENQYNDYEHKIINNYYLPAGKIGINHASKQIELAKEFVASIYKDEVQDSNVFDGFPVNKQSLKGWMIEAEGKTTLSNISIGYNDPESDLSLTGKVPSSEMQQTLFDMVSAVETPIEVNETIKDMILEEATSFLKGQTTAEQAATAILTKVNTYLSE